MHGNRVYFTRYLTEDNVTDSQLAEILTSMLDVLSAINTRVQAGAYADDHGQASAIVKVRALVATANDSR